MLRIVTAALLVVSAAPAAWSTEIKPSKPAPAGNGANCAVHGQGFIGVGGSTCVKLSGRVRAEAIVQARNRQPGLPSPFVMTGEINLDSRTSTQYGTVRGVVRYRGGIQSAPN